MTDFSTREHILSGECGGKRWEATYVQLERLGATGIRFEAVAGRWFSLGALALPYETVDELREAIEKRVGELQR